MYPQAPATKSGLRKFGVVMAIMISLLFGLALPWIKKSPVPSSNRVVWGLACLFFGLALILPSSLKWVHSAWLKFGAVAGNFNTKVILSVVYFVFFTPLALFFRLIGRNPLRLKPEPRNPSFRVERMPDAASTMERPF